jgi:beta-lactamase regulating signal transducer with metallopeptidase domain/LysM repeat protein
MNLYSPAVVRLELLGLLAAEISLVVLVIALLLRAPWPVTWKRILCQIGLVAVLLVAGCEISGYSPNLIWQIRGWGSTKHRELASGPQTQPNTSAVEAIPKTPPDPKALPHGEARIIPSVNKTGTLALEKMTVAANQVAGSLSQPDPASEMQTLSLDKGQMAIAAFCLLWLAGTGLLAGRTLVARGLHVALSIRQRVIGDAGLLEKTARLATALGMRRRVRLIECRRLSCPIAFGVFLPTVGLPKDFGARFDTAKQEAMLAHELAHLAAHDPLWCLLADLSGAVLWWHPAVWWLRRRFHMVSEMAADDASFLVSDGPRVLAECLVELGGRLTGSRVIAALPAAGFSSHLGCRVERLMNHKACAWSRPHRLRAALFKILGPAALATVVILCTAWTAPRALMKGETMKIVQLSWKQTLATLAAATSLGTTKAIASPKENPVPPPEPPGIAHSIGAKEATVQGGDATRGALIEAKLKQMVLEKVQIDGLPLSEVLKYLSEQSSKLDPSKIGVNFLFNPNAIATGYPPTPGAVDPATGLPLAPAMESVDISTVTINFNLPLRNVNMKDVLDAIVKVADHPIEYTVEDYAVVFSPKAAWTSTIPEAAQTSTAMPRLLVRTFLMNTNTFVPGLETAFGIKLATNTSAGEKSHRVQAALRDLMTQLGIPMENGRSVFYNELTGVVMVRATSDELGVVSAAMETLGGSVQAEWGAAVNVGVAANLSDTPTVTTSPHPSDKGFEYVIQKGDTLSIIAQAYKEKNIKVSNDDILKANPGLKAEKLKVGQKIFIPAPPQ